MKNSRYLVTIKGRYYCRVRWPKEVWGTLGDGAFKKSLNTDSRAEALMRLPGALQEFQSVVASARTKQLEARPRPLSTGEIMLLVARWYEVAQAGFKPLARPRQLSSTERVERREFIGRMEEQLTQKRAAMGEGDYTTLAPILESILVRSGLNADQDDESFGVLCQTLMRAWIAMEETALGKMRGEFGFKPSDGILGELDDVQSSLPQGAPRKSLGDLIEAYEAAKSDGWSQSTKNAYKPVVRLLRDALGENRDVRTIDREVARGVFEIVKGLPTGLGKRAELSIMPVPAAVAAARALGLPTISPKTINDTYMALTIAMFGWANTERWTEYNAFSGLRVTDAKAPEDRRAAFTADQLATVFGSAPWQTGEAAPSGKPSLYWGPLFGLFHGLRIGEICGLLTDEVVERDDIATLDLRPNRLRRLKNRASKRYIPVHPELIRLGFLDYVAARRAAGDEQLFPEAKIDGNGHYGDHVSDWFSRLVEARGLKGQALNGGALTLHSLRHNFEDALRRTGSAGSLEAAVLSGRQRGRDPVAAAYGNGFDMPQLALLLEKVQYPTVRLSPATTS
jgi:integrase